MDIPLAFSICLAENGWVVTMYDAYENPITVRLCPTREKVVEFLNSRFDYYVKEWDNTYQGTVDEGADFDEEELLPECFSGIYPAETIEESDEEFIRAQQNDVLEKPKLKRELVSHNPGPKKWWNFWKKD